MSSSSPSVACVGGGYWGPNLIRNVHGEGALSMLCDRDADVLQALGRQYPDVACTTSFDDILRSPVDAVVLATPAATHHDLAMRALGAGKHVFVEKPLALTGPDAEEMAREADRLGRVLMVGHILEYHPAYRRLLDLIREGRVGALRHVRSSRLSLGKLRHEENVLWSFAPHDVALVLGVVAAACQGGTPPVPSEVRATGAAFVQDAVHDLVHVDLAFPGGVTGHIHVSWIEPTKLHQLVVTGSKGMIVFEDSKAEDKLMVHDYEVGLQSGKPALARGRSEVISFSSAEPMAAEVRHFLDCVRTGMRPISDGWSGARVLRVLEAAQQHLDGVMPGIKEPIR